MLCSSTNVYPPKFTIIESSFLKFLFQTILKETLESLAETDSHGISGVQSIASLTTHQKRREVNLSSPLLILGNPYQVLASLGITASFSKC